MTLTNLVYAAICAAIVLPLVHRYDPLQHYLWPIERPISAAAAAPVKEPVVPPLPTLAAAPASSPAPLPRSRRPHPRHVEAKKKPAPPHSALHEVFPFLE